MSRVLSKRTRSSRAERAERDSEGEHAVGDQAEDGLLAS